MRYIFSEKNLYLVELYLVEVNYRRKLSPDFLYGSKKIYRQNGFIKCNCFMNFFIILSTSNIWL